MKHSHYLPAFFSVALFACGTAQTSQPQSDLARDSRVIVASNVTADIHQDGSASYYYGDEAKEFEVAASSQEIDICRIDSKELSLPQYPSGMTEGLSVNEAFAYCASKAEMLVRIKSLERRWNTGLLQTFSVTDSFDFLGVQASIVSHFTWVRCDKGAFVGGAHPTYRGGTQEAYQIAEKILEFVNTDKAKDEPAITLEDLIIKCATNS